MLPNLVLVLHKEYRDVTILAMAFCCRLVLNDTANLIAFLYVCWLEDDDASVNQERSVIQSLRRFLDLLTQVLARQHTVKNQMNT